MNHYEDKDVADFEAYLFSFMNDATKSTPLTNEEVVAILQNYGPPEEVSPEEKEHLVKLMKETNMRRIELARKMRNPQLILSLGELLHIFCEWKNLSQGRLARLLNLTEEQFKALQQDRVSPTELGKERILKFAALAGTSIQDLVAILDKTVALLKPKPIVKFVDGQVRVYYREATEPELLKVMEDIPKELKPALVEAQDAARQEENWSVLRHELLQEGMANKFSL
jgi:hypothetical protein